MVVAFQRLMFHRYQLHDDDVVLARWATCLPFVGPQLKPPFRIQHPDGPRVGGFPTKLDPSCPDGLAVFFKYHLAGNRHQSLPPTPRGAQHQHRHENEGNVYSKRCYHDSSSTTRESPRLAKFPNNRVSVLLENPRTLPSTRTK